ncbi:bifunctional ornithine acetyltransferase/N-acetylglutamate synthase, partial [Bacillus cereus]|uniref:bifunctional ornithine acetyltransferase/N-acetylglutamate synthase n=1 Tax=Bacillus cereus TaxID=1396 RepID=UPI00283C29FD
ASTGEIGVPLPMDITRKGIATLIPTKEESQAYAFSETIITTDLITKETCHEMIIDGTKVTIAGVVKVTGMIHPNMAT